MLRGRDQELAAGGDVLRQVRATGRGAVVSVVGGPHVGKTALVAKLADHARSIGFDTVRVGLEEELQPDVLIQALGGARERTGDLREVLERKLSRVPLFLVLDDLRWSGSTEAALETVMCLVVTRPLVCVLVRRLAQPPEHLERMLKYARDRDAVADLRVDRLPAEAVSAVVKDRLGAVADDGIAELLACAEGNAGVVSGLLAELLHAGAVEVVDGVASLTSESAGTVDGHPLPARVEWWLSHRVRRLSAPAREMLDVAAALGRTLHLDDVARMLDQPIVTLVPLFRECVNAEVLDSVAGRLRFRHARVWETLLHAVPAPVRAALHHQAAQLLSARGADPAEIAEHLRHSVLRGDASTMGMIRRAAEQALASSPAVAAELARLGVGLVRDDRAELPRLSLIAVEAAVRAGAVPAAVELVHDALRQDFGSDVTCSLRFWLTTALLFQDRCETAAEVLSSLPSPPDVPAELVARHSRDDSMARVLRGTPCEAPVDPVSALSAGLVGDALLMSVREPCGAENGRPVTRLGDTRVMRAMVLLAAHDPEAADAVIGDLRESVDPVLAGVSELLTARLELERGRSEYALAAATRSLEHAQETGVHLHLAAALTVSTLAALRRPDLVARFAGDPVGRWAVRQTRDSRLLALDWARAQWARTQDGPPHFGRVVERIVAEPCGSRVLFVEHPTAAAWTVRTALRMDRRDWAAVVVRSVQELAADNPEVRSVVMAAAHAHGVCEGDLDALESAATGHGDAWARASAFEDLGVALVEVGDRACALERWDAATALFEQADAELDAARLRRRMREFGVAKRRKPVPAPDSTRNGLTETEAAVIELVAAGLTNKEVAARMFISHHTVAFHLRKVFRKLGIGSRADLICAAGDRGDSVSDSGP
ncbi:LuxR C-terminal-related transcriptional regulator [Lentzea sp. NPDC059081]|uniref:helix-turn-helix transcriptional regulator n=1 Tax=Lentzea sp. NPDC059081 TaxID=3346719 RepID=UPI003678254D